MMDLSDCGVNERVETFLVSLAPEGGGGGGDRAGSFVELDDNHEDRKKNQ